MSLVCLSHTLSQVRCPNDYLEWLKTMYCLFGTKWSKLHCGPMCSFECTEQEAVVEKQGFDPITVCRIIIHVHVHALMICLLILGSCKRTCTSRTHTTEKHCQ